MLTAEKSTTVNNSVCDVLITLPILVNQPVRCIPAHTYTQKTAPRLFQKNKQRAVSFYLFTYKTCHMIEIAFH
jgi:hypothetical protein